MGHDGTTGQRCGDATGAAPRGGQAAPSPDATQTPQVESNLKPEPPLTAPEPVQSREASPASLVSAAVCRDFSTTGGEWRCTPITGSTAAGLLVFYTRVKSTQPMTIEHRWYRGETLHQRLTLRVAANQGAGYRTFSRNTVSADRAGTWRVELRDAAGSVLHQQTFAVQ